MVVLPSVVLWYYLNLKKYLMSNISNVKKKKRQIAHPLPNIKEIWAKNIIRNERRVAFLSTLPTRYPTHYPYLLGTLHTTRMYLAIICRIFYFVLDLTTNVCVANLSLNFTYIPRYLEHFITGEGVNIIALPPPFIERRYQL